jgi:tetraprenyl-beta-curcumene synthase
VSLSRRQLGVLARGATRELLWGLPAVASELDVWRALAHRVPDPAIRTDALNALVRKRGNTNGAALFWTITRTRSRPLLRLLVAYQALWDFLDNINERGAGAGQVNGRQLHLALLDALDPDRPISDYYRYHPWREDGGYLRALVEACREACRQLPSYELVQAALIEEAVRAQVLGINHDIDPVRRDTALRMWAVQERHEELDVDWFELTAAASASLTIFALLALGAEPSCSESDIEHIRNAYFPWISATATMLDSYVDEVEDAANGDHRYVAHYRDPRFTTRRLRHLIQRSLLEARALPNGERHELIVACMITMYLSKDSARTEMTRATTAGLISAGGLLTKTLLPILRLWRIAYAMRSA